MWPFPSETKEVFFTDTLSGEKKRFAPLKKGWASLYSCGPTVYGPIQIGNLRSFVLGDLVARTLASAGYKVNRVMNITDVGHMVGDAEQGEDKMKVGAARESTTPEAIADRYASLFLRDIQALNIEVEKMRFPRATSYIQEDIDMIMELERKGFTYTTNEGVYFGTSKFEGYGKLGGLRDAALQAGARVALGEKHAASDFVLWRSAKPGDLQKWPSPWGEGNPGWSIECSAMATAILGERIDIHTGGEDLASIHHNNEIAQSECSSGKHPYVGCWLHGAFLTINGEKLSKSLGNSFVLADVVERGFHPLALRYLFLQAHYRTPLSFSWEALTAAEEALGRLWKVARTLQAESSGKGMASDASSKIAATLLDDLATPQALALLWEVLGSSSSAKEKWAALEAADAILALSLTNPPEAPKALSAVDLPAELQGAATAREEARKAKDYARSDELRVHLEKGGYRVDDTPTGSVYEKL